MAFIDVGLALGRHRWFAKGTIGWLLAYKRLALRYDRTEKAITALASLAVTPLTARHVATSPPRHRLMQLLLSDFAWDVIRARTQEALDEADGEKLQRPRSTDVATRRKRCHVATAAR